MVEVTRQDNGDFIVSMDIQGLTPKEIPLAAISLNTLEDVVTRYISGAINEANELYERLKDGNYTIKVIVEDLSESIFHIPKSKVATAGPIIQSAIRDATAEAAVLTPMMTEVLRRIPGFARWCLIFFERKDTNSIFWSSKFRISVETANWPDDDE